MNWKNLQRQGPFAPLLELFALDTLDNFPDCERLNELLIATVPDAQKRFIPQQQADELEGYYEEIIANYGQIPTRPDNWHDLFNALVWMMFPTTKNVLNQLHIEDIRLHGVHPRTRRRDTLTHFDECGVILAVEDDAMVEALSEHQWHHGFVENRRQWFTSVTPVVFGHANYEMLLKPYLGLTGKWLAVKVEQGFAGLSFAHQLKVLDALASQHISSQRQPLALKPLPLLGVPGWWQDNHDPAFYDNRDYFRPKRPR